jgi:hypothetical protein
MRHPIVLHLFRDQRGIVLVMALMLMGLMSALAATYSARVRADTALRGAAGRERKAFYAAEQGLNMAMARTQTRFDNFNPQAVNSVVTDTVTVGSGAQQRTVSYELKPVADCYPCARETIGAGNAFAGLSSVPYRYTLTSAAENAASEEEVKLGADFTVHNIPIFQFLAFYRNDLYIMPLPAMTLNGRIHTNGDLRLNSDTTLSVADSPQVPLVQVSAGDDIFRGAVKYGSNTCTSNSVLIDRRSDNTPLAMGPCNLTTPVSQTTINGYGGSVLANVANIQLPSTQSMARGAGNLYWDNADLRIVLLLDTTVRPRLTSFCGDPLPNTNGVNGLFPIEVQTRDGSRDVAKTNALWNFMCQRRGAIFYTDIPTAAGANGDQLPISGNNTSTTVSDSANEYRPNFETDSRVYRRVGDDTSGDGLINNRDRNDDICPTVEAVGVIAPWWRPTSCTIATLTWPLLKANAPSTSWYKDNDYRRGGFYNRREDRWMYLLNVNIRALLEWNARAGADGGNFALISAQDLGSDDNGGVGVQDGGVILYLSVQGANSLAAVNNYGVRVFDSADLDTRGTTFPFPAPGGDPTGITIVSDQAAYIGGNFNLRDKYPAAILADALNILSQGWEIPNADGMRNDHKSTDRLTDRGVPAADWPCGAGGCGAFTRAAAPYELVVNAAFIAGVGPSPDGEGNYDGGLENYPRFHESWSNRHLQIQGAFVSLGTSLHAVNNWEFGSGTGAGIYDPPNRPWNYDAAFDDVRNLPPLTPNITYIQQRMYTRFYQ